MRPASLPWIVLLAAALGGCAPPLGADDLLLRADAAAARRNHFGHLDEETCARSCADPDRRLNFCTLEPDVPPPPPPGEGFVVCTFHHPGGCDMIIR